MAASAWTALPDGLLITVRLTPKGGRDAIDGLEHRADSRAVVKARVRAAPHEGAANAALIALLAGGLGTAPRAVDKIPCLRGFPPSGARPSPGARAAIKALSLAGASRYFVSSRPAQGAA